MRQSSCMTLSSCLRHGRAGLHLLALGHPTQVDMRMAAYLQRSRSNLPGACSQDSCSDKLDLLSPLLLRMCVAHAQEPAEQGGQRCAQQMKRACCV